jgi:hypothetical protein
MASLANIIGLNEPPRPKKREEMFTVEYFSEDYIAEPGRDAPVETKRVSKDHVRKALTDLKAELARSDSPVAFNLYTTLGIPNLVYFTNKGNNLLNETSRVLIELVKDVFNEPSQGITTAVSPAQEYNIFFHFGSASKPLFDSIRGPGYIAPVYNYKIHLMPKPEYAFYTIYKLNKLFEDDGSPLLSSYRLQTKININMRYHNLRDTNTLPLADEINGGPSPTIVIYSTYDKERTRDLLVEIIRLFPEAAEIGNMTLSGKKNLPPFNVRLNSLIAYAHGDRSTKLDVRISARAAGTPQRTLTPAKWFLDITDTCTPSTAEAVNEKAQRFYGEDACGADGAPLDLPSPYLSDVNMMTHDLAGMLGPEEVLAAAGVSGGGLARRKGMRRRLTMRRGRGGRKMKAKRTRRHIRR